MRSFLLSHDEAHRRTIRPRKFGAWRDSEELTKPSAPVVEKLEAVAHFVLVVRPDGRLVCVEVRARGGHGIFERVEVGEVGIDHHTAFGRAHVLEPILKREVLPHDPRKRKHDIPVTIGRIAAEAPNIDKLLVREGVGNKPRHARSTEGLTLRPLPFIIRDIAFGVRGCLFDRLQLGTDPRQARDLAAVRDHFPLAEDGVRTP